MLDRYCDALPEAGGPRLDPKLLWHDHRKMAAYAYASAAFTAAFGQRLQNEEVALCGVRKAAAALTDLDTLHALSSLS